MIINFELAETWNAPCNNPLVVRTVEILRATSDGFECEIRSDRLPACKTEYAYKVHCVGTKKTYETYRTGYATTLRGAKSAVSKSIAKLKAMAVTAANTPSTCVECNAPVILQSNEHCKDCDADTRWEALDIPVDIMAESY